ncbi:MAG: general secretion pathway protein GspB [Lysobacteraceae bacterium]
MSLILEALRKSEAERRLGETPTLLSPISAYPGHALKRAERRQRLWMWAALSLLLVFSVATAIWWHQSQPLTTPAPSEPRSVIASENAALADVPSAAANPAPPAEGTTPMRPNTPPPTSTPTLTQSAALNSPAGRQPDVPPPTDPQAATSAPPAHMPEPAGLPAPAVEQSSPAPQPTSPTPLPRWIRVDQLPAAERAALPPLKVSMHVYSDDPAKRAVLIDGQRHHEGEWIAEGILLKEIRRDGSLLDVRGREVLLGRP